MEEIQKQLAEKIHEVNALKIINSKLLTQLHYERQEKIAENSPLSQSQQPQQQQQQQQQNNKKKKKKSTNTNTNATTTTAGGNDMNTPGTTDPQIVDEHIISEDNMINSTIQELLINLQMENQRLAADILVLEEEVSKLSSHKDLSNIELSQYKQLSEDLSLQLELKTKENSELSHKLEILSLETQTWRDEANETQVALQDARERYNSLSEEFTQVSESNESLNQLKEAYETSQNQLEKQEQKIIKLNEEITSLLDQQERGKVEHLEELNLQRKSFELLLKESTQERNEDHEKIARLETLLESQQIELNEKITEIAQLRYDLVEMTSARDVLEKERNDQIEKYSTYQELMTEKELTTTKRWTERINSLENTLAETEEALLVSQSTLKTYEVQEVKSEYEKKKLMEEISVLTRMREKAEMRVDVETKKSQLSENLRKEAVEETQLLTQKCHQYEDDLDVAQKQLKDLKKEFRIKFDLVDSLQNIKYEQEKKIEELNDQISDLLKFVDIAAQVEPLKAEILLLQNVKSERDQLQTELEQLTNEMHTLSSAFELRGQAISEMEKQNDLIQSDISYLKLDDSIKRNKLNALQEIVNENKTLMNENKAIMEKQDATIKGLKNQLTDANAKLELLKSTDEKFNTLQISYKQSTAAYSELQRQHHEILTTMEELSQTAAEEIEKRNLEITRLNGQLTNKNQVAAEYERLSIAYEKLIHQYSDLMDERSQLFEKYSQTKSEIESIKLGLRE